jgi:DNA-binding CsgD family transcriptional regulator
VANSCDEIPPATQTSALDEANAAWHVGEYERVLHVLESARFESLEDRVAAAMIEARALLALDRPHDVPPLLRGSANDIEGAAESALSDTLFNVALEAMDGSAGTDAKTRGRILHALALIAAETVDVRLGRLVRREYESTTWPDDMRIERLRILTSLSWLSLLEGDVQRAWDERQDALTLAVDTPGWAGALVDAAIVSGVAGDRFAERRYLERAGALLSTSDAATPGVEDGIAMLAFVAATPAANSQTARTILRQYERARLHGMQGAESESIQAFELYARGKLAIADGATAAGVADLERSLEIWARLGYRLRVAIIANVLRGATADRRYAVVALDALRHAPAAWLRPQLARRANGADPLAELTPAERRVLVELCKGKKAREIADLFGRSFNTINNHTRAIFAAFGVRSRAALVAECARVGILNDLD